MNDRCPAPQDDASVPVGTDRRLSRRRLISGSGATMSEQLPDPENRVLADETALDSFGLPRPKLIYSYDDYTRAGLDVALQFHHEILGLLGATDLVDAEEPYGVGHLMGTYRMGDDPATSVTGREGRAHDHPNLWLAGSGLFPTMGTANPTLTIAALALLTADAIGREFNVQIPVATPEATPAASPEASPVAAG